MLRNSGWAILFIAVLAALAAPGAAAATVVNGNFESGTLNGWHVHQAIEAGNWFAYKGTDAPIGSKRGADPVQAPPQGTFAAISDEANPDTLILYQDIALEAEYTHRLGLLAYYDSYEPIAIPTPDTLSVDEGILGGQSNQQFRIDVMRPDAPLESVDPADILITLFQTKPGAPQKMAPTRLTANLSAFAGQTVRLRIVNTAHEEVFNAGIDAVSISSTVPGDSSSGGAKKHGPILFSFDKARANRRTGTVALRVRVSGSGLLRAKGGSASASSAGASGTGTLRKPIEPITVPVAAAKTVTIHLRPTPSARTVLRQKHKLRVLVDVTYMPTDDSPETASLPVVFRLGAHPHPRR
ncbi:MAG TPA: hypothetical protein VN756_11750 [Solirubrobacterales bacterium]|nr:hypothetical protein [Solirubrobacterales bacterium]